MAIATPASLKIKINSQLSLVRNTIISKKKAKNTSWYSLCSQFYNTGKTKQKIHCCFPCLPLEHATLFSCMAQSFEFLELRICNFDFQILTEKNKTCTPQTLQLGVDTLIQPYCTGTCMDKCLNHLPEFVNEAQTWTEPRCIIPYR
jgi:hypothetical protein